MLNKNLLAEKEDPLQQISSEHNANAPNKKNSILNELDDLDNNVIVSEVKSDAKPSGFPIKKKKKKKNGIIKNGIAKNETNDERETIATHTLKETILSGLFEDEYEDFGKLHNESAMLHCGASYVLTEDNIIDGEIYLTNFLLYFLPSNLSDIPGGIEHLIVPIASIARITEQQRSNNFTEIVLTNRIYRTIRFRFASDKHINYISSDKVLQMLRALTFPSRMIDLFAFEYCKRHPAMVRLALSDRKPIELASPSRDEEKKASVTNHKSGDIWGWDVYSIEREYNRLGITDKKDCRYRFTSVNKDFQICESYPELFVVPSSITDWELTQVSRFRRLGRIPILSWKSPSPSNVALFRCSQPKVAMASNRSRADEHLIQSIIEANDSSSYVYIMDARPKLNARVNKMRGGGFENTNFYKNAKLEFLNIDNIHIMRKSRKALSNLIHNYKKYGSLSSDKEWYGNLHSAEWMIYIREILRGTYTMIRVLITEKVSILCHCSDGWDRTSQLCSLVQLCLDPYFRTVKGFIILINKEWLSVGHQFEKRCGHRKDDAFEEDDRSPVFEQFVECTYQLLRQYPLYFEFNSTFLVTILDNLYSCKYGTFLCDKLKDRQQHKLAQKTLSLWTHLQNCKNSRKKFLNIYYKPTAKQLIPKYSLKILTFWKEWHLRNCPQHIMKKKPMYADNGQQQIRQLYIDLQNENAKLRQEIETLRKEKQEQQNTSLVETQFD